MRSTEKMEHQLNQELLEETEAKSESRTRATLTQHNPNENNERPKAKNIGTTFKRLYRYTLKYKKWLIVANLTMLGSSAGMVFLPMLCGIMIDHIRQGSSLTRDAINFLFLTLGMAFFSAIRGFSFNLLGELVVRDIRAQLFQSLVGKDISYYDKNKTGELISRLTSDVTVVESAASDNISILLRNLVQFMGSLVFLFIISWQLTSLIIVLTPIITFGIFFVVRILKKLKKQYQNNLAFANSLANEVFGNIRVVKSFSNEKTESANYQHLLEKAYSTGRKQAFFYGLMLLVITIFANLLILSILYFGGQLTIDGHLTIGSLASFVLYTVTLTAGFASVSGILNQIVSALGVCERLFQMIDEPVMVTGGTQKLSLGTAENVIQFKNVTFSYPTKSSVNVLQNFDFAIRKGESVAIVGASGQGKSSIISLILRFYDINEGELLVGGKNIKGVDVSALRREIGYVSQQPTLFSGSLRENIEYGLEPHQKSDEKVLKALKIANATSFALNPDTFPQKLDTLVGERGVKLSGGQKQRIAIARSVIKEPAILIFDEATSALDAESEHLVQAAIDNLVESKQNTMIVIAHRLSTIINCDRIVVLKDGVIGEMGSHSELLSKNGLYKNLVQKQLSGFSKEQQQKAKQN